AAISGSPSPSGQAITTPAWFGYVTSHGPAALPFGTWIAVRNPLLADDFPASTIPLLTVSTFATCQHTSAAASERNMYLPFNMISTSEIECAHRPRERRREEGAPWRNAGETEKSERVLQDR